MFGWHERQAEVSRLAQQVLDLAVASLREALPDHNFTSGQFLSGFKSRIMQANDDMFAI